MKFLLSISLTLLVPTLFGQVPKDTTNKIKKFDIAFLTASTVVIQMGLINVEESRNYITYNDEKGRAIESTITNLKDKNTSVYKYEYDECQDYKRKEWLEYHDDQIDTMQIQTITLNSKCQIEKIVSTDSTDSITSITHFMYYDNGKQTKEIERNAKGELTSFLVYSYPDSLTIDKKGFFGDSSFWYHSREYFDTNGNTLYTSSFDDKNNETVQGEKYSYKDNKIVEAITYDLKGEVIAKTTYTYNSEGMLERTESKSLNKDDSLTISTYRYFKRH